MPAKLAAALAAVSLTMGTPAFAEQQARLPPLDNGTHDESLSERACGAHPHTHTHTHNSVSIFYRQVAFVASKKVLPRSSAFLGAQGLGLRRVLTGLGVRHTQTPTVASVASTVTPSARPTVCLTRCWTSGAPLAHHLSPLLTAASRLLPQPASSRHI